MCTKLENKLSSIEDRGQTDLVTVLAKPILTLIFYLRWAMVMTHTQTKSQRSFGLNDKVGTNGRTDPTDFVIFLANVVAVTILLRIRYHIRAIDPHLWYLLEKLVVVNVITDTALAQFINIITDRLSSYRASAIADPTTINRLHIFMSSSV